MKAARAHLLPFAVATSRGPLRVLWALAYRAAARVIAAWFARNEAAAVYLRGSGTGPDVVYGLSDLDFAVITEDEEAAERVRKRWALLKEGLEPLGRPVECHYVESRATVEAACAASVFTHGLDRGAPGPGAAPMQERPCLDGEVAGWRRLRGRDMRPPNAHRRHAELERPSVAWLELQFWWRHAFLVASHPPDAWLALSCVKLVAEPLRALMWLEDGDRRGTRAAVLGEARRRVPEQEPAIAHALDLWRRLPSGAAPDTGLVLRSLAEVSERVARRIGELADGRGYGLVALDGLTADRPLDVIPEAEALPLVDWRARTLGSAPDQVFVPVSGDAADASRVAEVAAAARTPVYPVLTHGPCVMVLPTTHGGAARQRCAQCPASDPVSFAVASGRNQAAFPELPGWSARDAARRAVDEHAVRLPRAHRYETRSGEGIARLLAAGRVALMAQSCAAGVAALPLTATATATALVEEAEADRATVDEALGWYMDGRAGGVETPRSVVDALRGEIRALPAYRAERVRCLER
jgi:hypothetical protein